MLIKMIKRHIRETDGRVYAAGITYRVDEQTHADILAAGSGILEAPVVAEPVDEKNSYRPNQRRGRRSFAED